MLYGSLVFDIILFEKGKEGQSPLGMSNGDCPFSLKEVLP